MATDDLIQRILNPSGFGAARAASQRQPAPYVDEEEERSLIRELRDKSLTTVGALGNILDLPGSMVRDVGSMIATGKWVNPVDQLMSMTSSENRTSGKDLLQQTGLAGPGESWGKSIGGFGLEMAMDPLTYMTLGATAATKAGQAASKFGLADDAIRVATKKAGAAPGSIGAREARLTTTAQDIAANSTGIVKKRADDFLKTLTPEEAAQPLGGLVGIGLPFMQPKFVFGTGPKSIAAAKGLDAAGRAIRFGKIPGTDVQNPVGAMLGLFDAAAKGAKTPEAAFAAREAFRAAPRNEATVRASVANMAGSLAEVTRDLDSPDAKEIDAYLRSRPWYVEPKNLDERYGLISDAMLEAGELAGNDPTLIDSLPKSLQWITDQMKFENSLLPKKTRLAGGQVTELNDNIDYMARFASVGGKIKSGIGEDASTFDPSFGYRRLDFLRDIPGGTVAFKRGVAMDPVLHDMVEKKVGIDAVETYLLTKHGGWLPDTYTGFYQSGKNKGKAYVKNGRYKAMAKMLYRQDIDVLKRGVFGNSVIFDHLNRQLGSVRQTSALGSISDLLASKDPTGAARYIKPVKDWEAGGVNIGAQDDTTMPMGEFLKTMGLPAYAIHKDLKKGVDRKGGFLRALAKKMGVDHKELRHARIDKRIADDLIRIHKAATTRGPGEEILEMTDSVTNLTKAMLTSDWPSFHVRNLTSGWAQNAMLGMWDKQTAGWAGQIMSGNAMKGAARVDWSASEYARRARAAGWDDASITAKLRAAGHSQAKINQFLSQAGKARKSAPPGQGPGPLPPQSPPGPPPQGPLPPGPPIPGLGPQGPIPPGQVSPTTSPLPMADPLVADADALLAKIDAGGAMPAMITGSLRRLAKAVGVDVTNKMKPADVVEAIRQARRNATPGTQPLSADMPRADRIDIDGVARPTLDSTGAPIHSTEDGVKNFWHWFDTSKAIDKDGKPAVLYHTTTKDFTEFKPGGDNPRQSGKAIFLGGTHRRDSLPAAHNVKSDKSAGARVIPVYANIRNPLVLDDKTMLDWAKDVYGDGSSQFPYQISDKAIEQIKADGYDGIHLWNDTPNSSAVADEYIAFSPEQIKSATGNRGTFDQFDTDIRNLPNPQAAPEGGFYSKLQQATQQKVGGRIDWQQFQKTMKGAGVKDEEIADIGMEDFFKTGPKTKKEVEQYIEANTPEIEIIEKGYAGEGAIKQTGQTRFEGYSVPGGEPGTYREVLIKLPEKEGAVVGPKGWGTTSGGTADSKNYRGPHWDEPNVIAHLRVDDVVNPDGTKTLRVTEVQSDWHQEGRKRGYKNESPERIREAKEAADNSSRLSGELQLRAQELRSESGFPDSLRDLLKLGQEAKLRYDTIRDADPRYVALAKELQAARQLESQLAIDLAGETPDGPFKKSWSKLAIKQALRMAVEEGYDEVGLVVGRDAAKAVGGPVKELDEAYSIMLKDAKDYTKKYKSYVGETQVPGTAGSSRAPQHSWSVFDENGVANLIEDETGVPVAFISRVEGGRYEAFDQFDESIGTFATQEEARRASQTAVESANEELLGGTGYDGGLHIFKITDEMRREIGEQGQSFYLPNPKAGSLFESASETPVDRTGFTPAQVGFESANMPKPASGDPWNKKSFAGRTAEHAKFSKTLDGLVSRKVILQKDADLLRVAFFGASEEGMKIMNMPKFGGRAKIDKGDPLGRWSAKVHRGTGEIIDPRILIKKEMPEGQAAFNTTLHELGHMAHQVLKRDLGKAWDDKLNEVFSQFRDSGELQAYFDSVHGKGIGRYLAGTANENFAQLFADSITRRKVPEGAIKQIISDIRDWIVGFLERLKLTTPLPTELTDRIDEIVDSLLGYDGKKLSDLVPQPKATAPSQVSPVPGVAPTRQVPPVSGVSPVPPVSSVPTPGSAAPVPPVPPAAVVPSPASAPPVGPPTGPPVVPPGPPGPPMGPPPGPPPRRPVRGVDSTFPDPKTGKLPDLDDTLATTMLGQRAYADGVIGSIDSDRAGDLAGSFEVQSGTLRDVLGGIPRPGHKSFSPYRVASKAFGMEPGTTYNPLDRRGVGGRTATKFAIGAAGEEVGHFGEGLVRLQPYFALIKKGYDPSVAAEKVAAAQVAYSNRNFTDFELKYMRRLLPFYKFSRQQIPFQMKQLMEKPGGTQAQLIRGLNQAQSQGELAPDYVRDTASIPVSDQNPILKAIIGSAPAGTDRYLSGLGLMAEDLYSVGPGVRGTGQEFLSRLNPMVKGPLEYFTNQSFFQAGPEGGRPLDEMDPLIGRTIANITGQKDPVKLPQILEVAAANSPISRFLTTARTLTDPRKRSTMSPIPLPGAAAAINLLTGARVTDVSPGSKDAIVRDLLTSRMKGAGARAFERVNFTKEDLAKMSPEERETALQLQGLANVLARRSKERAAERKKAEGN